MTSKAILTLIFVLAIVAGYVWGRRAAATIEVDLCAPLQRIQAKAGRLQELTIASLETTRASLVLARKVNDNYALAARVTPERMQAQEAAPPEFQPASPPE